ncbi:TonB-dependent receptor domain-containing protein [Sphingomonas faeni]|uniref:TonB-dependent receptor domain-containing protein n=1 Tax=Sphingomonas faeni TaxID=185950 RepID=UPI0020C75134|nr:TonB-dependent receptor [Sphingomonas faeni]MCP8893021.1 TonB-dependent receptor [Sphingomonas faeni]
MTSKNRALLRGAMMTAVVLGASSMPVGVTAQAAPIGVRIARQDMSDALLTFSRQSGKQILFSPTLVRGKTARAVAGRMDVRDALTTILRGSGLTHRMTPGGAYLIVAEQEQVAPATAAAQAGATQTDGTTAQAVSATEEPAEDIVVIGTAGAGTRRQNAAFAVTTIDGALAQRLGTASTAEVLRAVPGVSTESSGGKTGANIFVRGYPSGGDAEYVTFQSEGVPFFPPPTLSFLENTQLIRIDETIQRVEAVRGGTGALFSNGQPGLTINLVQREGKQTPDAMLKLSGTDFGEFRVDSYVSGPIDANTTYMVGGYYSTSRGIRDAQFEAERGGQITANIRHDFDKGSLLVFGRYLDDRGQWLLPIPVVQDGDKIREYAGFDAGTGTLVGRDTRIGVRNDGSRVDLADGRSARIYNIGGNFDYELAHGITVRDRGSWLEGDADTIGLVPGGTPPISAAAYAAGRGGTIGSLTFATGGGAASPNQQVVEAGLWSVEKHIQAFVNDFALEWKSGRNTLTGGVYYSRYKSRDRWNLGNSMLLTAEPNARRLNLTLADGRIVTRDGFTSGSTFKVNARYTGEDLAGYAVDELQITDQLRIDGGVRWQRHSVDGTLENLAASVPAAGADGSARTLYDNGDAQLNGTFRTIRYRGDAWSWTGGVNYDLTRQVGAFIRYSRGNSFPFFDNLRDGIDVAPQVDSYEGGVKVSTGIANLYATVFHNTFDGLATTVITSGAPIASIGGAKATGVELEGQLRPFAGFTLSGSATYLDATYRDFFTDGGRTDLTGNRVQRQPKWQWRVTPAYDVALGGDTKAGVFATIGYVGDRFSDIQNAQVLPNYYKLDAGLTLDLNRQIQFQVIGDNLTDEIGLTEGNPRTLGAQGSGTILARPIVGRSIRFAAAFHF